MMNRAERNTIVGPVKANHAAYLAENNVASSPMQMFTPAICQFARKFQAFTRKSEGRRTAETGRQSCTIAFRATGRYPAIRLARILFDSEKE